MTAVEWLYNEIKHIIPNDYVRKFEQAKEMEKGQICESYIYGAAYGIDINNNLLPQNYYEEKYDTK